MEHNLCLLIDFENIAAGAEKEGLGRFKLEYVIRRLKDKGRILVSRAYGDWGRFARFKQDLLRMGINLMELTSYKGQEKNRADIALVVDAMELAYTRHHLDTFVVLSGDSDFTPLIQRLKELNKRVIGVGTRRSTSALLKDACDEFIFYDTLVREQADLYGIPGRMGREPDHRDRDYDREPDPREQERDRDRDRDRGRDRDRDRDRDYDAREPEPREVYPREPEPRDPNEPEEPVASLTREEAFGLMVETLKGLMHDSPGPVAAGLVKASILRKEPAFNETEYGYSGFTRMLEAAQDKGIVVLSRDDRGGGVRVDIPGDAPAPRQAPQPTEPEVLPELPGLSGEAARLREVLSEQGFDPLPRLYRHTVIYEFADHVRSRMEQKKRNTFIYTVGDVARRCRDTVPPVSPRHVRVVLQALAQTGELLHTDGKPARSPSAPFVLRKDAEGLLEALSAFYVRVLLDRGETLSDASAVSQLLYGDDEHGQNAEELVAWGMHEQARDAENPQNTDHGDGREAEARDGESREPREGRGRGRGRGRRGDRGDRGDRDNRGDRGDRPERGDTTDPSMSAREPSPAQAEAPEVTSPIEPAPVAPEVQAEPSAPSEPEAAATEEAPEKKARPRRPRRTRTPSDTPPAADDG